MMLLKIIMREEHMLVGIAIISIYMFKVLKLCLFCLPMIDDSCSHKLFSHKIPMHRKWVGIKSACHVIHDALLHVSNTIPM